VASVVSTLEVNSGLFFLGSRVAPPDSPDDPDVTSSSLPLGLMGDCIINFCAVISVWVDDRLW